MTFNTKLFCDCQTDEEKGSFFLSGRAYETGVISSQISNDVAMTYYRCANFKKEIETLQEKIDSIIEFYNKKETK